MVAATFKFNKEQQDLFRPRLRKTKLCSFFEENRCRKGENCAFAHGQMEMEVPPDLTKTSLCLAWKAGTCESSAANCRFAHGKHDLRFFPQNKLGSPESDDAFGPVSRPPGLLPGPSVQDQLSAVLGPMKVTPSKPLPSGFEPMKVMPSFLSGIDGPGIPATSSPFKQTATVFTPGSRTWEHWEGETVAGETSSDDDGSHSSFQPASLWQPQELFHDLPRTATAVEQSGLCSDYMDQEAMDQLLLSPFFLQSLNGGDLNCQGTESGMVAESYGMVSESWEAPFQVHLDPPIDVPASAKRGIGFGRSPGALPTWPCTKVDEDQPEFQGFSSFSGMPRLW